MTILLRYLSLTLWCVFLSAICSSLLAQQQKPHVINYARAQYGAASKNWAVGQDEKGVMYFANDAGLLESDGMDWHLYACPGNPLVRALAVRSHDVVYTGGDAELG